MASPPATGRQANPSVFQTSRRISMDSLARRHREHAHKRNDTAILRGIWIVVRLCALGHVQSTRVRLPASRRPSCTKFRCPCRLTQKCVPLGSTLNTATVLRLTASEPTQLPSYGRVPRYARVPNGQFAALPGTKSAVGRRIAVPDKTARSGPRSSCRSRWSGRGLLGTGVRDLHFLFLLPPRAAKRTGTELSLPPKRLSPPDFAESSDTCPGDRATVNLPVSQSRPKPFGNSAAASWSTRSRSFSSSSSRSAISPSCRLAGRLSFQA